MNVALISNKTLLEITNIGGNIDKDKITPQIIAVQDIKIQRGLGTRLYKKIIELVTSGDISLPVNEKYKELLDTHITPTLANFTGAEVIRFSAYEVNNTGVVRRQSDNGLVPESYEVDKLAQRLEDRGIFYFGLMRDYICKEGQSVFPEYYTIENGDIRPGKTYRTGWNL